MSLSFSLILSLSLQDSGISEPSLHPQLDTDIEAVRTLFSDSAVSVRSESLLDLLVQEEMTC